MYRLAWDRVEPEGMGWFLFRRRGSLIYGLPMCTLYSVQSVIQEEQLSCYCLLFFKMIVV